MKVKDKCLCCGAERLVNRFGLCKRCNPYAYKVLSQEELERIRQEHEAQLAAEAKKKAEEEAKKAEKAAEEVAEGEEAEEIEKKGEEKPKEAAEGEHKEEKQEEKK